MADKTSAEIVAEALGKARPTRHDWIDDLEGGLNHRPESSTTTDGDDPALEERIAALRAKATELGINRKRNNR